jgi:outer membrane receptor protein involved in Fe transport
MALMNMIPTRSRLTRLVLALALGLCPLTGLVGVAHGSGAADEAELQFQIAAEHYQKGEFRDALEHFLASNRLVPNKNVVFNIARTYEKLGRYADAHRYYTDALDEETNPQTIQTIKTNIARIAPNVAVLRVETSPPGATLYIDRKDLGSRGKTPRALAVPEGKYRVIVELEGYEPATSTAVEVKLGAEARVPLTLTRIVGAVEVAVSGAPSASVHVDDEKAPAVCEAPCRFELPPGQHLLYFGREGFQAPPRQVNVIARTVVKSNATLSPLTGSVVVSADERDAVIEIDGRPMGFTPAVIQNVAVGARKVRVLLRGYAPVEREVEVKTGQQAELTDLKLTPLRQVSAVSRYAESIEDAPSSVSILDGQELRAFGYPTIAEALRGTRGFSLSNDRAYYSVAVRGLGEPNDYGNRVLVLSDGASLNDNLLNSSYIGSDSRNDLHDVSRIEVVRGPGSLLYGTGAFSGLVNLVPREKEDPSHVQVGVGTYDNAVARGRVGFHYNFTPTVGIQASASAARSDGVDVPITLRDMTQMIAHNTEYFRGGGTTGRFWAGPLTVQWYFNTREQHMTTGVAASLINDLRTIYADTRYLAEIRYEPKPTENVEIFTRIHGNRYSFHGEYSYDEAPGTPSIENYYGTWVGGEARVAYTPIKAVRLTAGGEYQNHFQATLDGTSGSVEGKEHYLNTSAPYQFGAGYVLGEASPASWFRASAGVRLDGYSTFGAILVPRAALIFKPWTGGVIKLMGGRAFRAPSIYERFYTDGFTQDPGDNPNDKKVSHRRLLAPESVYSGELEISQRFKEDWVALVAGHGSYVQNIINTEDLPYADSTGAFRVAYTNSKFPAIAVGGDVEIRREWRQGWMLSAYYSYEHARYISSSFADPRLINAPEHLAAFKGVVPVLPDIASIALRVTVEAPRRIDLDSDALTPPAVIGDLVVSGAVKRFGIGYAFGVYNALDSRYQYPVSSIYLTRTIQQNGRTFLGDITVTYP